MHFLYNGEIKICKYSEDTRQAKDYRNSLTERDQLTKTMILLVHNVRKKKWKLNKKSQFFVIKHYLQNINFVTIKLLLLLVKKISFVKLKLPFVKYFVILQILFF